MENEELTNFRLIRQANNPLGQYDLLELQIGVLCIIRISTLSNSAANKS